MTSTSLRKWLLIALSLTLPFDIFAASRSVSYPCAFMTRGVPAGVKQEQMHYSMRKTNDGAILLLEGSINAGESQRLENAIRETMTRAPIMEIWLNSGGGDAIEGMEMGRVLRRLGVPTRIPSGYVCFSACSYAFLGGPFRTVERGADYGVHMFTASEYETQSVLKGLKQDININSLTNTEDAVKDIEQESAKFAALLMDYLSEMGISSDVGEHNFDTANKGGSCPPPAVLKKWNVVNSD